MQLNFPVSELNFIIRLIFSIIKICEIDNKNKELIIQNNFILELKSLLMKLLYFRFEIEIKLQNITNNNNNKIFIHYNKKELQSFYRDLIEKTIINESNLTNSLIGDLFLWTTYSEIEIELSGFEETIKV